MYTASVEKSWISNRSGLQEHHDGVVRADIAAMVPEKQGQYRKAERNAQLTISAQSKISAIVLVARDSIDRRSKLGPQRIQGSFESHFQSTEARPNWTCRQAAQKLAEIDY